MARSPASEHRYAVILAGGSGTRFWPLSRRRRPKQLLELLGRGTLLERTVARLKGVVPPQNVVIITGEHLRGEVRRVLPRLRPGQILAEPAARNTAPAIGLVAHELLRRDPEAVMAVLPSDHLIAKPEAFRKVLAAAFEWADTEGRSVTLGLKPTRPDTGFGYIRLGRLAGRATGRRVYRAERFTEKPPYPTARRYVASGKYLWNGGMFVWRASTFLCNLERFRPEMARGLEKIARAGGVRARKVLARVYPGLEKISVDYAVMEKARGVYVIPAEMGWSDVGSWAVVHELSPQDRDGNARPARSLCFGARGNMIVSPRKFVMAVGVEDLVIVETDDALLVCAREKSQDVGKAVEELGRRGLTELL
jgi:mannose-1-phosphate guanylyltransferase